MAKILTQEEVDALLEAVSSDDDSAVGIEEDEIIPDRKTLAGKKVSIYNFRRPDRISKEQLRSLHFMHDRFARNFSSSLSAYLRTLIEVDLLSVEQLSYAEFLLSLPDPTCFNAISVRPLEGSTALEINPEIVFPIIDKMLGGVGDTLDVNRRLTEIEQNIIEAVIRLALENLKETWKQVAELEFLLEAKETSPQLIQIATPNEVVVLIVFEIKIGDASGMMNFCIPTSVLEPLSGKFDHEWNAGQRKELSEDDFARLRRQLYICKHELSAEILGTRVKLQELIDLDVGDLVMMNFDKKSQTYISIGNVPKFAGAMVVNESQRTFLVKSRSTGIL